jgi:hypothetical protein
VAAVRLSIVCATCAASQQIYQQIHVTKVAAWYSRCQRSHCYCCVLAAHRLNAHCGSVKYDCSLQMSNLIMWYTAHLTQMLTHTKHMSCAIMQHTALCTPLCCCANIISYTINTTQCYTYDTITAGVRRGAKGAESDTSTDRCEVEAKATELQP